MTSDFWIDDYERDAGDLVLFVSCFGQRNTRRIAEALQPIENVKVERTDFVETIQQEVADGVDVVDDHYIVTARVTGAAVSDTILDHEYDHIVEILEQSLGR